MCSLLVMFCFLVLVCDWGVLYALVQLDTYVHLLQHVNRTSGMALTVRTTVGVDNVHISMQSVTQKQEVVVFVDVNQAGWESIVETVTRGRGLVDIVL